MQSIQSEVKLNGELLQFTFTKMIFFMIKVKLKLFYLTNIV
jgi:hypothetical protein